MMYFLKLFATGIACVIGLLFVTKNGFKTNGLTNQNIPEKSISDDSIVHVTISAVGDLMCHSTQYNYARIEDDSFNFLPCYEYVMPYLQSPDLLIGNLETTLAGNTIPYSGYPQFNTPDDYAIALKQAGFDLIVTANNHSNDTGEKGILRTIQMLDSLQLHHTGTYISQADRDSMRIININGIKLAIIAYTFSTNGLQITPGKAWLVNYMDSLLIKSDIQLSRSRGAELVLIFYHYGEEYKRMPTTYQQNFVNHAIDCGADIIIGSHPHVIQPAAFYKTKNATLDSGFVAYSLGNFFSNQSDEFTDEGIILNLHLSKNLNSDKIKIESADYVPTWVYRGKNEAKKLHVIFPVYDLANMSLPSYITNLYQAEMNAAYFNTINIMSKMSDDIRPVK